METKHTQGEWYAEGFIVKSAHKDIAEALRLSEEVDNSQREANAKLIAAAPELLEACKHLLDSVNSHRRQLELNNITPAQQSHLQTIPFAQEAIKKATV